MKKLFLFLLAILAMACNGQKKEKSTKSETMQVAQNFQRICGGIVRGDTATKKIALVFTSDGYYDGYETIRAALQKHKSHASFFFTGNAYRNSDFKTIVENLKSDGNYMSAHSDKHILYCAWEKRDSTLVTRDSLIRDVENNYAEMKKFGIEKSDAPFWLPAYEYYNDSIVAWSNELGLTLVNFTGGTSSNADYTVPSMGNKYRDSETLYNNILKYEAANSTGLNGFMLMIHFGVDPERTDKLYNRLDDLMTELEKRGYSFVTVAELLK